MKITLLLLSVCLFFISCTVVFKTVDDVYYSIPKSRYQYREPAGYYQRNIENFFYESYPFTYRGFLYGDYYRRDRYLQDWYRYYPTSYRFPHRSYTKSPAINRTPALIRNNNYIVNSITRNTSNYSNINTNTNTSGAPSRTYTPSIPKTTEGVKRPTRN